MRQAERLICIDKNPCPNSKDNNNNTFQARLIVTFFG